MAIKITIIEHNGARYPKYTNTLTGEELLGEDPLTEIGPDPDDVAAGAKEPKMVVMKGGVVKHNKNGKQSVHAKGSVG